jgi:serine/threonine-protein kinase
MGERLIIVRGGRFRYTACNPSVHWWAKDDIMPGIDLYCRQCNQRFNGLPGAERCPICGRALVAWRDIPTLVFADTQSRSEPVSDSTAHDLLGTQLGNYWIESFLGEGGMARVYRARHLTLERPCAIKVLRPALAVRDADAVASFLAEARAAAALVHPHVVTLHTIGREHTYHFLEMEYVDGLSLARVLDHEGPIEATEATRWMLEVSSALAAAHRQGMIHRDIKPANVMVNQHRVTKLADFGLAKRLVAKVEGQGERFLIGTPHYMAPELFRGLPADTRSDVYALGVTYYSLLTGQLPINSPSLAELAKVHHQQPEIDFTVISRAAGESARRVLERCLAFEPEERYIDAVELHRDFRALYGSLRSLDSLVRAALADTKATWTGSDEELLVSVPLPQGRRQLVHVEIDYGATLSENLITIYSVCAPADERYFRQALESNAHIPHGALAISRIDGQPHFVVCNAYPRSTCDVEELRQSVLTVARFADEWEQRLTGGDTR